MIKLDVDGMPFMAHGKEEVGIKEYSGLIYMYFDFQFRIQLVRVIST